MKITRRQNFGTFQKVSLVYQYSYETERKTVQDETSVKRGIYEDDVFIDENADSAYDTFLSILTSLINKCLPLKKSNEKLRIRANG